MRSAWVLVSLSFVCCGRSSLEPTLEDDVTGRAGMPAVIAGASGRNMGGGTSGGTGTGGFGFGGTLTTGGSPFQPGGTSGQGGFMQGGANPGGSGPICELSPGDCRSDEVECELSNFSCEGAVVLAERYTSALRAGINVVVTEPNGRVAVAGYYQGEAIDLGGGVALPAASDVDGFVISLDAFGTAQWVYVQQGPGVQSVTGLAFAPNGDLVLQASWDEGPDAQPWFPHGSAIFGRLDPNGVSTHELAFGDADETYPGGVAVDNNGTTILVGGFSDDFAYGDAQLTAVGECGYLVKLSADDTLLWHQAVKPDLWLTSRPTRVVADDEDSLIVIGEGTTEEGAGAFFQKRSSQGQVSFTKELFASTHVALRALAVDRGMRITLGGAIEGELQSGDFSLPDSGSGGWDAWVAQYSSSGEPLWAKRYASDASGAQVASAGVDAYGNVIVSGTAHRLDVEGQVIEGWTAFALKLRAQGDKVWLRSFKGRPYAVVSVAVDNSANVWLGGSFLAGSFELGDETVVTTDPVSAFLLQLTP